MVKSANNHPMVEGRDLLVLVGQFSARNRDGLADDLFGHALPFCTVEGWWATFQRCMSTDRGTPAMNRMSRASSTNSAGTVRDMRRALCPSNLIVAGSTWAMNWHWSTFRGGLRSTSVRRCSCGFRRVIPATTRTFHLVCGHRFDVEDIVGDLRGGVEQVADRFGGAAGVVQPLI